MEAIFLGYKDQDGSPLSLHVLSILGLPQIKAGTVLQIQQKQSFSGEFPWRVVDPEYRKVSLRDSELSFSSLEEIPLEDYL